MKAGVGNSDPVPYEHLPDNKAFSMGSVRWVRDFAIGIVYVPDVLLHRCGGDSVGPRRHPFWSTSARIWDAINDPIGLDLPTPRAVEI